MIASLSHFLLDWFVCRSFSTIRQQQISRSRKMVIYALHFELARMNYDGRTQPNAINIQWNGCNTHISSNTMCDCDADWWMATSVLSGLIVLNARMCVYPDSVFYLFFFPLFFVFAKTYKKRARETSKSIVWKRNDLS